MESDSDLDAQAEIAQAEIAQAEIKVWADVGGTFTDCFVISSGRTLAIKVLSSGVVRATIAGPATDLRAETADDRANGKRPILERCDRFAAPTGWDRSGDGDGTEFRCGRLVTADL